MYPTRSASRLKTATSVRLIQDWALSIVDDKRIIRPETGDVHFFAYIAAFAGSHCSLCVVQAPVDGHPFLNPIFVLLALATKVFPLLIPFAFAGIGVWATSRMILEWHLRRPFFGIACATVVSFVGTLLFIALLDVLA